MATTCATKRGHAVSDKELERGLEKAQRLRERQKRVELQIAERELRKRLSRFLKTGKFD